jgi:hypothetical protein
VEAPVQLVKEMRVLQPIKTRGVRANQKNPETKETTDVVAPRAALVVVALVIDYSAAVFNPICCNYCNNIKVLNNCL